MKNSEFDRTNPSVLKRAGNSSEYKINWKLNFSILRGFLV